MQQPPLSQYNSEQMNSVISKYSKLMEISEGLVQLGGQHDALTIQW